MDQVANFPADDRAALFRETAARMGLASAVIPEKDFWVCFALRRVFALDFTPRVMFKGGTSLSKAFGLIDRFSEDIDLTLSREDLGFGGDDDPINIEGTKARKRAIESLSRACGEVVRERLLPDMEAAIAPILDGDHWSLTAIPMSDGQVDLRFGYPRGLDPTDYGGLKYIQPAVRMEIGARSDQEPVIDAVVQSYASQFYPDLFAEPEAAVRVLAPERTFWEKITIFHAEYHRTLSDPEATPRAWNQLSRHAYDIARMAAGHVAERALERPDLLDRVARHKATFFRSGWAHYEAARPGTLRLVPNPRLEAALRADYDAMKPMLFGDVPGFDEILRMFAELEYRINRSAS